MSRSHADYKAFGFSEVLAGIFEAFFVYFSVSMMLLNGILSILTDVENGSTQNSDLSDVTNLDQIPTVGYLRRGGPGSGVWQKIDLSTPKSCREGPGSVIVSKYVYVGGSLCAISIDLVIISIVRAPGSWESASKLVKTDQNS